MNAVSAPYAAPAILRAPFIGQIEPGALVEHFLAHPPEEFDAQRLNGGLTAFTCRFDILTTADPGLRQRVQRWPGYRHWRQWLRPRARFVGSTVTEYAWLPRAFDPAALVRYLRVEQGRQCPLLIIKDLPQESPLLDAEQNAWARDFAAACVADGFVLLEGQALAWVPIDFASVDAYVAALSRGRRRDLRRKLQARAGLDMTITPTGMAFDDDALINEIYQLYCNVYAQSEVHFDFLGRAFFAALLRDAVSGGVVFQYRHAGRLIGWNLCYEHADMLIDKYMGLRYPDAREHNLYAVSWIENLRYAQQRGLRRYVAGWTDPAVKAHLGASFTFTRHAVYLRSRLLRLALRRLAPMFESDRVWSEEASCSP